MTAPVHATAASLIRSSALRTDRQPREFPSANPPPMQLGNSSAATFRLGLYAAAMILAFAMVILVAIGGLP